MDEEKRKKQIREGSGIRCGFKLGGPGKGKHDNKKKLPAISRAGDVYTRVFEGERYEEGLIIKRKSVPCAYVTVWIVF